MNNNITNIGFIIDTIKTPSAGTEKQLLMLLENLDRTIFTPHLICLKSSEWLKQSTLPYPVHILEMPSLRFSEFRNGYRSFKQYCQKNNIELIQTYFRDGNIFGTIASHYAKIKYLISSRRNHGGGHWHNWKWLFILKQLRRWTTLYISNSENVAEYTIRAEKVSPDKIITIMNSIKFDRFQKISPELRTEIRNELKLNEDELLIGLVANWREVKNIPLFLQVADKLKKKYASTKFIVIGVPPSETELNNTLNKYNIKNHISFIGPKPDIIPYLSAFDIGILCSKAEGLSNSIIEYMAAGIPSVVSRVGGNPEAIGQNAGGLVFESDSIEDFYEKLEIMITDSKLRAQLGLSAKKFANENFEYRNIVKKYEDVFTKLLNHK